MHSKAPLRTADPTRITQRAYIAEAAFEYFVTLTTTGTFLTLLIKQMGVSDALTGILSGLVTLAGTVQVFAVSFIRRQKSIRGAVLFMQTLQQVLYALVFLLPVVPLPAALRVALFAAVYLVASVLGCLVAPAKYNWFMSFVAPGDRGIFTARKEMISLLTGLVYTYGMSLVVDHCAAIGKPTVGLVMCAAAIGVWTVFHIITVVISHDAPEVLADTQKTESLAHCLRINMANRRFVKLLVLMFGWNFLYYFCIPYHSVYLLQELGQTATFIAIASIVGNGLRFVISVPMGRLSDKHGFDKAVEWGLLLTALSWALLVVWTPANGAVMYLVQQAPYAVAMALISGGMYNILYQYVPVRDRVGALGLYLALSGIAGFIGSLAGGWLLGAIQGAGNRFLGFSVYGQQVLNALAALGLVALVVYDRAVIEKMEKEQG